MSEQMRGVFSQRLAHVANRGIHEGNWTDDKGRHGFVAVSDRPDESCVFGIRPDVVFVKGNTTGLEARTELDAGRSTRAPIEADCRRLGALSCNGLGRWCRVSSTAIGVHQKCHKEKKEDPVHVLSCPPAMPDADVPRCRATTREGLAPQRYW